MSDWIFWIAGAVVGALGLALATWGIIGDRAKGRRRCPRCWYDMGHTPGMQCPECGRSAKSEKRLQRSRRRLRAVALALLLLAAAAALGATPMCLDDRWVGQMPSAVLYVRMAWITRSDSPVLQELQKRRPVPNAEQAFWSRRAEPWARPAPAPVSSGFERWVVAHACARALKQDTPREVKVFAAQALEGLGTSGAPAVNALTSVLKSPDDALVVACMRALGAVGERAAPAVGELILLTERDPDLDRYEVRTEAIRALGRIGPKAAAAVPTLTKKLSERRPYQACDVLRTLGQIGNGAAPALPRVKELARHLDPDIRAAAVGAIAGIGVLGEDEKGALIDALWDGTVKVREAGLESLGKHPGVRDSAIARIRVELRGTDHEAQISAATAARALGADAAPVTTELVGVLGSDDAMVRYAAAWTLQAIGPGADAALSSLKQLAGDADADVRERAAAAVKAIVGEK